MRPVTPAPAALHLAAILSDPGEAAALRAMSETLDGVQLELRRGPAARALAEAAPQAVPDAVLLEVDPQDPRALEQDLALVAEAYPKAAVIALCAEASLGLARRLMRQGVLDLVPRPLGHDDLHAALSSLRRRAEAPARQGDSAGRSIAFLKAGGGCGATTLAVQTAVLFAARATGHEPEVCLLDLDLQSGAAALALDLDDRVGLGELLEARERLDGALLRSLMGHHGSGLDVLAAPRALMALDAVSLEALTQCLRLARAEYRSVVLDLPPAWTAWSHAALGRADLIALVVRPDVPSVRRARRQLDALAENGLGEVPLRLVLNRCVSAWRGGVRRREAEQVLGRPFDFLVCEDAQAFGAAFNRGLPLGKVARWSRAHRDVKRLAAGLAMALARAPARTAARRPSGVRLTLGEVT